MGSPKCGRGFWLLQAMNIGVGRRSIKHVYRNVFLANARGIFSRPQSQMSQESADATIDPNVVMSYSRVPKLFHLPTNFANIAYSMIAYRNKSPLQYINGELDYKQ